MKTNLLIVDDNTTYRATLKCFFEDNTMFQIVGECSDGNQVLPFVRQNKVDIILMDINMKETNGIEATKEVKQHFPFVKIVLHSSNNSAIWKKAGEQAGANGFVPKMTSIQELIAQMESIVKIN